MLKIEDDRRSGKTTKLIELAIKDEAILVVPTFRHVQSVRSMSEIMGVSSHLAIMTFYEFLREILWPGIDSKKKYYIDELDKCLEAVGVLGYSNSVVEED